MKRKAASTDFFNLVYNARVSLVGMMPPFMLRQMLQHTYRHGRHEAHDRASIDEEYVHLKSFGLMLPAIQLIRTLVYELTALYTMRSHNSHSPPMSAICISV